MSHCSMFYTVTFIPFNIHFLATSSCITSYFVLLVTPFNIHFLSTWCAIYSFLSCSSYGNKLAQWCVVTDRRLGGALLPPLLDPSRGPYNCFGPSSPIYLVWIRKNQPTNRIELLNRLSTSLDVSYASSLSYLSIDLSVSRPLDNLAESNVPVQPIYLSFVVSSRGHLLLLAISHLPKASTVYIVSAVYSF